MLLVDALNLSGYIIMGIGGVILVVALAIILFKFVFLRKSYERQVKDLERKFSYLDALMIGQDSQYIKRLEMISRTNLLYVDVYNTYSSEFKRIYEIDDQYAKGVVDQLKNLIAAKQYRQMKTAIAEGRKAIVAFEEKALKLDKDLTNLIKPEEESRQVAVALKEKLRDIKKVYSDHSSDLEPVAITFNKLFDKLDSKFMDFETCIEGAKYDEGNNILPVIDQVLTSLSNVLKDLPQLCVLCFHVIPDRIAKLKEEAESLAARNYPLTHLMLNQEFTRIDEKIKQIKANLVALNLKNVRTDADILQEDIENMHNKFENEVNAKEFFNNNWESVYQKALDLEKRFLRLCSLLPNVYKLYKITDEAKANVESLQEGVNRLGSSKRALDAYMHSTTAQAYSILQEKLNILMKDYEEVNKATQDFRIYIDSLKTSCEEANALVFAYYYRLKACEQQVRNYRIPACETKYQEKINVCYELLNGIKAVLKVNPMDVAVINEKVEELKNVANELFDDVNKDGNVIQMAESAILIANRDRKQQRDVHQQLNVCEEQFFNGNFDKTYHDVVTLIKRRHVEETQG